MRMDYSSVLSRLCAGCELWPTILFPYDPISANFISWSPLSLHLAQDLRSHYSFRPVSRYPCAIKYKVLVTISSPLPPGTNLTSDCHLDSPFVELWGWETADSPVPAPLSHVLASAEDREGFTDELLPAHIDRIVDWTQRYALAEDEEVTEPQGDDIIEMAVSDSMRDEESDEERENVVDAPVNGESEIPRYRTTAKFAPLPTPPRSHPSALLAHNMKTVTTEESQPKEDILQPISWQAAFLAGGKSTQMVKKNRMILDKAKIERLLGGGKSGCIRV